MSACAGFQDWHDAGVPSFSKAERDRIWKIKFPGDRSGRDSPIHYPRSPIEDPGKWFADHRVKLRGLERAEGL